ncbi:MAG: tetratricopeptide repeat protein [Methanoregula sp.]|jgi:tetratricopeptide (TPR) repeat protein|uniref:tetratricopeptide repeat protein n=1 Tax=Methanoregula sp. TaxID=2052170 RepID=UPI003C775687
MPTRVFIVEDDEIISHLIRQFLTLKGYIIAGFAESGDEVLSKIPGTPCDVILMDIGLKGDADGITVARILSSKIRIPIIFVTGQYDDHILQRAKTSNTYGYIIKPFSSNDLISNIEIALFNHRLREEQPREPKHATVRETLPDAIVKPAVPQKGLLSVHNHTRQEGLKPLYDEGFYHRSKGNYQRALQCFIEILEYDPDDAFIWAEKGDVLQNLGRTGEALVAIDTALRIDPANEYALCKKSRVLCSVGRHADALVVIEVALGITRDNLALLVEKGAVLHELGRNEEAIKILDSTIELDRKSAYALGAKGRVMAALGRNKEALASFGRALNIEPKNISLWMDFIRIFEQKKNYSTALNIVQMAMEKNPENQVLVMKRDNLLSKTIPVS